MHSSNLRLFLDTADVDAWKQWLPTGIFYGVTTNPLLLNRARVPCTMETLQSLTNTALALGVQEVQLQTWGSNQQDMIERGQKLASISDRVVIKVPLTLEGIKATQVLKTAKLKVTLTAAYAHQQVIIADGASVEYIAPYLGRMTDLSLDGKGEIIRMQKTLTSLNSSTRILVASIRAVEDLSTLMMSGLNTFTISPAIAQALFDVLPTQKAATEFERAAQRKMH